MWLPKTPFIFNAPEEEVFNNNFKPDVIFHRGNEIKSLAKYYNPLVKRIPSSKKPLMAFLSGSVGSGKSLVVEALIKSLGEILRPKPRTGDPTLQIIKVIWHLIMLFFAIMQLHLICSRDKIDGIQDKIHMKIILCPPQCY